MNKYFKKCISLFFLFFLCYFSYSQTQLNVDSLNQLYNNTNKDTLRKLELTKELIQAYLFTEEQKAFNLTQGYIVLAKSYNAPWHLANAYKDLSNISYLNAKYDRSNLYIDSSLNILELNQKGLTQSQINRLKILLFNSRANNLTQLNDVEGSTEILLEAKALCVIEKDHETTTHVAYHIANNYYYVNDNISALQYYKEAAELGALHQVGHIQALSTAMIGATYMLLDSFDQGRRFYEKAIKIADSGNYISAQRFAYLCYAQVFENENKLDSALMFTLIALEKTKEQPNKFVETQIYIKLARIYNLQDKISLSREYYTKYKALTDEGTSFGIESEYLIDIAALEKNEGNYVSAYNYLIEGHKLKDSLEADSKLELIKSLELKFDQAQNEIKIAEQNLLITQKNKNATYMVAGLVTSLLACLTFYFLFQNSKKRTRISLQDAELKSQKISQLEKEKKLLAMNAMMEGQEAERIRIAKDLHDGLGGLLSTVKARLSNINNEVKKIESYNIYEKTTSMVDEACDEVRRISHNLLPGALRLDGLKTAIEHLGEELEEAHPFKVTVEVIGLDASIEETKEVFLYRIIQEATNNIIKYARAKKILIQLSATEDEYHLIIEDDGIGFDTQATLENTGLGLKSIQSRVDHLQGELDLSSKLGIGTTISIHFPK